MSVSEIIESLCAGRSLGAAGIEAAAACLLDADADVAQKADMLRALSRKGETPEEIAGFVKVFLRHAVRPPLDLTPLGRPP